MRNGMWSLSSPRRARIFLAGTALLCVVACVTVNIYFPAAEVKQAAETIVEDVYAGGTESPGTMEPATPDDSSSLEVLLAWLTPGNAWAQSASTVSNASIRKLKEQITRNHGQLGTYYEQGAVGISSQGLLEIRETKGLPLPEVAKLKRLIAADNQVRQQLYREVAAALSIDPGQIDKVQRVFAEEWQSKAPKGYLIQDASGAWRRK